MMAPTPDQYIIGIGGLLGHDANIAIFKNNNLLYSAQEERFSRKKHDAAFPKLAIADGLEFAGISSEQIEAVVFAEKPLQAYLSNQANRPFNYFSRVLGKLLPENTLSGSPYIREARQTFRNAKIHFAWHHLSHAAGAYHTSNFENAAFLCVDGKGEDSNASIGVINNNEIKILEELKFENGVGMLYTIVTHFLGFPSFGSEYKIMGLAPYGNPVYSKQIKLLITTSSAGALKLKRKVGFHPNEIAKHFDWLEANLGIQRRKKEDDLSKEHVDLAASIQSVFEEEILKMAKYAKQLTSENNLIFCGGCAQNCVTAGKLRDSGIFDHVYNSPVGGDMGSGLGAALLYLRKNSGLGSKKIQDRGFYLGSLPGKISSDEVNKYKVNYTGNLHNYVAGILQQGYIVGWVRNGMELGARALGARSILANPMDPEMQTKMNLKIKFRESFRPFAPAILEEEQANWFDCSYPSNFMQYTAFLNQELRFSLPDEFSSFREQLNYPRCKVPSIVHVDYSARLQTVSKDVHPDFHRLISSFYEKTGVPILINTSFNVNGQPIIRTADEAWECFINTEIDFLVVNDEIYQNPFEKTKEQKQEWLKQFDNYSR